MLPDLDSKRAPLRVCDFLCPRFARVLCALTWVTRVFLSNSLNSRSPVSLIEAVPAICSKAAHFHCSTLIRSDA